MFVSFEHDRIYSLVERWNKVLKSLFFQKEKKAKSVTYNGSTRSTKIWKFTKLFA